LTQRFGRLAAVNILSSVTVPLVGLVDTAMLGHLPDIRFLAGVALASLLFDYLYWTLGFLRMSTTGLTAQAAGRDDPAAMTHVAARALLIAATFGALILILAVPARELGFRLLTGEASVEAAGREYFDARIWGAPAVLIGFVIVGRFLGRADVRHVLAMTACANLANIGLNYLFIMRLGMAARGAGLASMLSQYLMVALGLLLLMRQRGLVGIRRQELLDRTSFLELFRLNRDILLRTLCLVSSFALFVNASSYLGTSILAANSLLLRIQALASYLIDGAAYASETLAGMLHGQKDRQGLRQLFRLSLGSGLAFAVIFLLALLLVRKPLFSLLTSHEDLIEIGLRYLPWLIPVLLFGSLAYMYDGLFLGLTAGRRLRNAMLLSTFGVFVPICGVAVMLRNNHLLWASMALFMAARTLTLAWRFKPDPG
jgi:MATE family multidrug resistance protein